jgi:hypothetical protein
VHSCPTLCRCAPTSFGRERLHSRGAIRRRSLAVPLGYKRRSQRAPGTRRYCSFGMRPRRADSACGRVRVLLPFLCRSLGEVDDPARECRCFVRPAVTPLARARPELIQEQRRRRNCWNSIQAGGCGRRQQSGGFVPDREPEAARIAGTMLPLRRMSAVGGAPSGQSARRTVGDAALVVAPAEPVLSRVGIPLGSKRQSGGLAELADLSRRATMTTDPAPPDFR